MFLVIILHENPVFLGEFDKVTYLSVHFSLGVSIPKYHKHHMKVDFDLKKLKDGSK